MEFEWNKDKAKGNLSKHGVSFDEAQTVFDDPLYLDFYDLTTLKMKSDTSSLDNQHNIVYWLYHTPNAKIRFG